MTRCMMTLLWILLMTGYCIGQAPDGINYQAIVRDSNGDIVADQAVGVEVKILQGSTSGTEVYSETHTDTTNAYGLVTFQIGGGTVMGMDDFTSIDWSMGPYYVQIGTDPIGGTDYSQIQGASQLLSVPYALYANASDSSRTSMMADTVKNEADGDPTNEKISMMGISGDSLSITEGGMTLKVSMDSSNVNELQSLSEVLSRDSLANQRIKNVVDPVDAQDAATKAYIDDLLISFGISLGSAGIEGLLTSGYSVSDLLTSGYSVSDLLSAGASPLSMHTAGVSIDSLYGKTYAGGLIFYLDTLNTYSFEGLVAAPEDQSTGIAWITGGSTQFTINGNTIDTIGTGLANTEAMMNQAEYTGGAAKVCLDYMIMEGAVTYDDWFLPSKDELHEMYENLKSNGFGGFAADFYWSSTENGFNDAWGQNFNNGLQVDPSKSNNRHVRAVRAF